MSNIQSRSSVPPISLSSFVRELTHASLLLILLFVGIPASLLSFSPLVILSGLIIVGSLWAMQQLVGVFNLRQLSIPSFFYLIYICVILIPGFFIFQDEVTASRFRFLIGIESVMITVPLGIWIANICLNFRKAQTSAYFRQQVAFDVSGPSAKRIYVVFLILGFTLVLINLWEMPVIPLLYLIRNPGEFITAAVMREDSFKLLNSPLSYAYYVLRGTVFPFLIMVAFGRYRQQKRGLWRRLFLLSMILGVAYASITIEKSPVAAILALLGIFYYLFKGGKLGKVGAFVIPAIFISFPVAVVMLAYQGTEGGTLMGALQAMGERIFYSPAQVVYAYFEVFPSVIPFQHGASLLKLAHLMGWQTIDIPNSVGLYMTGGSGIDTISANSCFIGNFYADFGLLGVAIGGAIAGFLMQLINVYHLRKPKTIVSLASYAICTWACGMLVSSALSTQMLSGGVLFALALRWLFNHKERVSEDGSSRPPFNAGFDPAIP